MQRNRQFQKGKRPSISRQIVDFLHSQAPDTCSPREIVEAFDGDLRIETVYVTLKRALARGEIVHDGPPWA